MSQPLHVVIIGAGICGLLIAQGLEKNGISYVVLDRETAPRDRNWGVTISWSHPDIEKLLPEDVWKRIKECQPDSSLDSKEAKCESVLLRDGRTGETMVEPPFPGIRRLNIQKTKNMWHKNVNIKVKPIVLLHMRSLVPDDRGDLLISAFGFNHQFGKRLSNIEMTDSGPVANFQDGTSEAGTIIIGADGNASFVRKWLLGDDAEPQTLPYAFMNFPVSYTAEQARYIDKTMHPIVDVGVHPKSMYIGLFLLDKPDLERPETWIFYILASWPIATKEDEENTGNRLQRLRDRMDDWAEPFKSAVAWVPDGTEIKPDKLKIWIPKPWDNRSGQVTIAGDAAHSMTFHRGQGGNNALKDSERFVNACMAIQKGEMSLKEAIDMYDKEMFTRGKAEVEMSKKQTDVTHDHKNFLNPDKSPVIKHGIKPTAQVES